MFFLVFDHKCTGKQGTVESSVEAIDSITLVPFGDDEMKTESNIWNNVLHHHTEQEVKSY